MALHSKRLQTLLSNNLKLKYLMRYERRAAEQKLKIKIREKQAHMQQKIIYSKNNGENLNDSSMYETFLDHDLAKEDTQIVEKDRADRQNPVEHESPIAAHSLQLSMSGIESIRNTSIYQDFKFAHMS